MTIEDGKPRFTSSRSDYFVASVQIQGLRYALQMAVQSGQQPGPATESILRSLLESLRRSGDGVWLERLPEIQDGMSSIDLLAACEVINASYQAFLSPEELEDQRDAFGFHAVR